MRPGRLVFPLVLALLLSSGLAFAQASRTWVSGVGDDANPCSRTAPCKTWAGAISKTAPGGEIDALDPAGYGAVTITKAITLDGGGGQVASVLVSGTNGIVVQAGASDVVTIRNLMFEGLKTGINGIRFLSGAALNVENVSIRNFTTNGIDVALNQAGNAKVTVKRSTVLNCNGGVKIYAVNTGGVNAEIEDTSVTGNATFGVRVEANASAVAKNVTASQNLNGFYVTDTTGQTPTLSIDHCTASHNTGVGVRAGFGGTGLAKVFVSDSNIFENGTGLQNDGTGQIISFGNNRLASNVTPGAFTSTQPLN